MEKCLNIKTYFHIFFKFKFFIIIFLILFCIVYNLLLAKSYFIKKQAKVTTIFCIIFTQPKHFDSRLNALNRTWVQQCNDFRFISIIPPDLLSNSTKTKQNFALEINSPYKILQPSNHYNESYKNLTDKVFKAYLDIYKIYNKYDWYLKTDDDVYIFMDHLREFLQNKNPKQQVSYGYNFKDYQSGGAGYVFSKATLKKFGTSVSKNFSYCKQTGVEDVDTSVCFRKLNITFGRTEDDLGRERFHPFSIRAHLLDTQYWWLSIVSLVPPKKGIDSCSNKSISFHYTYPEDIEKIDVLWKDFKKLIKVNKSSDFREYVIKKFL